MADIVKIKKHKIILLSLEDKIACMNFLLDMFSDPNNSSFVEEFKEALNTIPGSFERFTKLKSIFMNTEGWVSKVDKGIWSDIELSLATLAPEGCWWIPGCIFIPDFDLEEINKLKGFDIEL